MAAPAGTQPASVDLDGGAIIRAVKQAGVRWVVAVPDLHTARGILYPVSQDKDLKLIRVCKEDECFGIAAGLECAGERALILIQYTGFLYAMNAIRAVAIEHKLPMCMMIGLLSKEPDVPPRQSLKYGVSITEPILDVLNIPHHYIDTPPDIAKIKPAIENAYATSRPVAMLIGRKPVAP